MISMLKLSKDKKSLLRWCGWFSLGNAILFWLIGLKYAPSVPWIYNAYVISLKGKVLLGLFFLSCYIGHLTVLAFLSGIAFILFALIFSRKWLVFIGSVFSAALMAWYLISDSIVYSIYHFHITYPLMQIMFDAIGKQFFAMSSLEYLWICVIGLGVIFVESALAWGIWRAIVKKKRWLGSGKWLTIFLGMIIYVAYSEIFLIGNTVVGHMLIPVTHALPLYAEVEGFITLHPQGRSVLDALNEKDLYLPEHKTLSLKYPLHEVQCKIAKKPLNLVLIVIDTWRFDMLNTTVAPNLAAFAKQSWVFNQHMSGGNCTGPGVFSLFYGLPSYYWSAVSLQQRAPVLMEQLIEKNYQMGIFASATLKYPAFNKNIFLPIKDLRLRMPGNSPIERDKEITKEFQQFVVNVKDKKRPFFSFLFYDLAHSYCHDGDNLTPFKPAAKQCARLSLSEGSDPAPYLNRYKNAVYFVDQQVNEVIQFLRKNKLLENTVVVITGDHGEEFNDNHAGYWGHGSNFTKHQVQTPLIVYWPGEKPTVYNHQTSHYDIAPTLMNRLWGCSSNFADYSLGNNLLDNKIRPYLIANSYLNFGVLEKNKITTVSSSGRFQVEEGNGQSLPIKNLNVSVMQHVLNDLGRFYQD